MRKNMTVNLAYKEICGLNRNGWNIGKELLEAYFMKRKNTQLQIPLVLKSKSYTLMGVPIQDIIGFVNSVNLDNRQADISIYKDGFDNIFDDKVLGFGLIVNTDNEQQVSELHHITCAYPIEEINSVWRQNNE